MMKIMDLIVGIDIDRDIDYEKLLKEIKEKVENNRSRKQTWEGLRGL